MIALGEAERCALAPTNYRSATDAPAGESPAVKHGPLGRTRSKVAPTRPLQRAQRALRRTILRWRYWFALLGAERQLVQGLPITSLSLRSGDDDGELRSRVAGAVNLLATQDPKRFDRIKRDLNCVFVFWIPGSWGRCFAPLKLCLLDAGFVADAATTPELIAATIVHEATHARFAKWGIGYDESMIPRVERVCLQAEVDFAAKLPDGQSVREVAEAGLLAPDAYWTSPQRAQNYLQDYQEAIDKLAAPRWFRRLLQRRARKGAA